MRSVTCFFSILEGEFLIFFKIFVNVIFDYNYKKSEMKL
jgi:hypothetical protein